MVAYREGNNHQFGAHKIANNITFLQIKPRVPVQNLNPIVGDNAANFSSQWVSENNAAQSAAAIGAHDHVTDSVPVAGISTRLRSEATSPYFVWTPAASVPQPADTVSSPTGGGEVSEYMQNFRRFTASEMPQHVKAVYVPTNPIGVSEVATEWVSENNAAQSAAAIGTKKLNQITAGITTRADGESTRQCLDWSGSHTYDLSEYSSRYGPHNIEPVVHHRNPDHLKGSVVMREAQSSNKNDEVAQWRTEYIERFCSSNTASQDAASVEPKAHSSGTPKSSGSLNQQLAAEHTLSKSSQSDDNCSVKSSSSRHSRASTTSSQKDRQMMSAASTQRFHFQPPAVKLNLAKFQRDSDEESLNEDVAPPTVGLSEATVVGDTCSSCAHFTGDQGPSSVSSTTVKKEEANALPNTEAAPSRPKSKLYSTEYSDQFKYKKDISVMNNKSVDVSHQHLSSDLIAENVVRNQPEVAQRPATSHGATEYSSKFAWPDAFWYNQNSSLNGRSRSAGRLGLHRSVDDSNQSNGTLALNLDSGKLLRTHHENKASSAETLERQKNISPDFRRRRRSPVQSPNSVLEIAEATTRPR